MGIMKKTNKSDLFGGLLYLGIGMLSIASFLLENKEIRYDFLKGFHIRPRRNDKLTAEGPQVKTNPE